MISHQPDSSTLLSHPAVPPVTTVARPNSEREAKRAKVKFHMFLCVFMKYLEQKDPQMHARAEEVIRECAKYNKKKEQGYGSVTASMKTRLRTTVGDLYWKRAYEERIGNVILDTKYIPFGINARRNPRMIMKDTGVKWNKYEGTTKDWICNAADMEMEDGFLNRILGKHPTLHNILHYIPYLEYDWDTDLNEIEMEHLILDKEVDLIFLRELYELEKAGGIEVNLNAHWNRPDRKGGIEIIIFLQAKTIGHFGERMRRQLERRSLFSRLLCSWSSSCPFKLSSLTLGIVIEEEDEDVSLDARYSIKNLKIRTFDSKQLKSIYQSNEDEEPSGDEEEEEIFNDGDRAELPPAKRNTTSGEKKELQWLSNDEIEETNNKEMELNNDDGEEQKYYEILAQRFEKRKKEVDMKCNLQEPKLKTDNEEKKFIESHQFLRHITKKDMKY